MKKFFSVFAFMLIFPALFFVGCQKTETSSAKSVKYNYIAYTREQFGTGLDYNYTFQVNVENNTENDVYIVANNFTVELTRNYGNYRKQVENVNVYKNSVAVENKIEMSYLLHSGESQLLCISVGPISTNDDTYGRLYSITLSHDGDALKTIRID